MRTALASGKHVTSYYQSSSILVDGEKAMSLLKLRY
jgi:hypothetical protein